MNPLASCISGIRFGADWLLWRCIFKQHYDYQWEVNSIETPYHSTWLWIWQRFHFAHKCLLPHTVDFQRWMRRTSWDQIPRKNMLLEILFTFFLSAPCRLQILSVISFCVILILWKYGSSDQIFYQTYEK